MTAVRKIAEIAEAAEQRVDDIRSEYAPEGEHPIGSYAVLLATYGTMTAALGALVAKRRKLPARFDGRDYVLLGVATQKLSRLVAKDSVGAAIRAPFTRFEGATGEAEVQEKVRGSGLRHAIGELVTCPFCLSVWIATIFSFGLVLAPRATRFAASILATVTLSDSLQFAYARVQRAEHS
ncbi:MAG: hypothetical protein QOI95_1054 [Acidimicrobiaceae bacterium]|jgi:hypothetical protein